MQEMKMRTFIPVPNSHSPSKISVHSLKQSILMSTNMQPYPETLANQSNHTHSNINNTSPYKQAHPLKLSTKAIRLDNNNTMIYNNSLTLKNEPLVEKFVINLEHSTHQRNQSQEKPLSSHNYSLSKRKKFISVTQRSVLRACHSEHKVTQKKQSGLRNNKPQSETKTIKQPFIQYQQQMHQFSISQFLTPTKSIKQYLTSVINTITKQPEPEDSKQQEKILNEDDINQNNNDSSKIFSSAQKAKLERNEMKTVLNFHEKEQRKIGGKHLRLYTQSNENHKKNQSSTSSPLKQYNMMTEPNQPSQSRNFMVFEGRAGQNTLTRKDSLILALMQNMSQTEHMEQNYSQQSQFIPFSIETPHKPKKSISVFTQQSSQIPLVVQQKLKQKVQSHQQRPKQQPKQHKSTKIKFISLMQKQQSIRLKNCVDQNAIKDQFINLQRKSQRFKNLPL